MSSSPRSSHEPSLLVARSKTGAPYAQVGTIRLHSAYDPMREARRFVEALPFREPPSVCVVLGEAFGYLSDALRARFSATRILAICYDQRLRFEPRSNGEWDPSCPETVDRFFDRVLSDLDVEGLEVIEWQPSAAAYPERARAAREAIAQTVRERTGSLSTIRAFGPRWARNAIVNFLSLEGLVELGRGARESGGFGMQAAPGGAVVIAASGPSLEEALPLLARKRHDLFLIALPSSLAALAAAGLCPDLVVATDAGYWASLHLAEMPRLSGGARPPVAMPLSAARGVWRTGSRVALLDQGGLFERALLALGTLPSLSVAANGTVAAVALEVALQLSDGPIVFAGLDLCFRDIHEHVRPHTFDFLWATGQSRLNPLCGTLVRRALDRAKERETGGERTSPAFRAYAGWLARARVSGRRVYRLNPSSVELPAFPPLDADGLARLLAASSTLAGAAGSERRRILTPREAPILSERRAQVRALLRGFERHLAAARSRASGEGSDSPLELSAEVGEMLLELDAGGLLTAKRAARLEGEGAARARLLESIERVRSQLSQMRELYLSAE